MFELSKINFIDDTNRQTNYSFVGLQKSKGCDKVDFYLPIGFENFPKENFEEVRTLFLGLYKIFKKYQKDHIKNRDGNLNAKGGFEFKTMDDESVVLYSKINMFDTILDDFDDIEIYAFDIKRNLSDKIDYDQIDIHIDKAMFLDDDTFYLDKIENDKDTLAFYEAELVEMFCYIYVEIKKVLEEDDEIVQNITMLASNFQRRHLTSESSLFAQDHFASTKEILKERLEIIERRSLLKDAVYEKLYDAIYTFLYGDPFFEGEDDIYWGVNNFAFIWEEMGHHYFFEQHKKAIVFADTDSFETTQVGHKHCYKRKDFEYPFILRYGEEKKYLYPDIVINYGLINYRLDREEYSELFSQLKSYDLDSETIVLLEADNLNTFVLFNKEKLKKLVSYLREILEENDELLRYVFTTIAKHDEELRWDDLYSFQNWKTIEQDGYLPNNIFPEGSWGIDIEDLIEYVIYEKEAQYQEDKYKLYMAVDKIPIFFNEIKKYYENKINELNLKYYELDTIDQDLLEEEKDIEQTILEYKKMIFEVDSAKEKFDYLYHEDYGERKVFIENVIEHIEVLLEETNKFAIQSEDKNNIAPLIIDFKYELAKTGGTKRNIDIKKQLFYDLACSSINKRSLVKSYFCFPSYATETFTRLNETAHKTDVGICTLNFYDAQKSYLEEIK